MVTYNFKTIGVKATIKGECSHTGCNKKVQQTKKFEQTLNPYNRNKSGNIKTEPEILREVSAAKKAWINSDIDLLCKDHK